MKSDPVKKAALRGFIPDVLLTVLCLAGIIIHFSVLSPWWASFRFYTLDSNLLLLTACLTKAVIEGQVLTGRKLFVPSYVSVFKYVAVSMTSLTFLVVALILVPMAGGIRAIPQLFFRNAGMFLHFLCPLTAAASLIFADRTALPDRRVTLAALLPTLLYALILTLLNLLRIVDGPYPFLRVWAQPIWQSLMWFVAILTAAWTVAWLLWFCTLRFLDEMIDLPVAESRGAWTEDGYLKDQDCLQGYVYRTIPASHNGCGPLAAFNLRRFAGQSADFGEVLAEMDRLHLLCVPGPTFTFVMRRYLRRYLPGFREVSGRDKAMKAAEKSRMGLFRYLEQRVPHFACFIRTESGLRFFNVSDGKEDSVMTAEEFAKEHLLGGKVRLFCWE